MRSTLLKEIQAEASVILKLSHSALWGFGEEIPLNKISQAPRVHNFPGNKELHLGSQLPSAQITVMGF